MELKARGSENRHIPVVYLSASSGAGGAQSLDVRTDNDELLPGEGLILRIQRHCKLNIAIERASRQETADRVFEEGDNGLH